MKEKEKPSIPVRMRLLILAMFILTPSLSLFAIEGAEIIYVEGDWFTLISSEGTRTSYEPAIDDVLGLIVETGDTLLTEEGTFIELALGNSSSIIKIAENTTFKLDSLTPGGGGVFEVAYGRIRAKVDKLSGEQDFWITGYDTVAGIRGTDFGFDLFFDPDLEGDQKSTTVYCFEGAVEVLQQKQNPAEFTGTDKRLDYKESLLLESQEMVRAFSDTPNDPLIKVALSEEIINYWKQHDFSGNPTTFVFPEMVMEEEPQEVQETPIEVTPVVVIEEEAPIEIPQQTVENIRSDRQSLQKGGGVMLSLGVGLATAGLIAYIVEPENNMPILQILGGVGGVCVLTGGGLTLYSLSK